MPRRKGSLFLPLDVNFMDDPRIVRAGRDAAWLYLAMCLASKRLGCDGRLEPLQIQRLHVTGWKKLMPILLREELVLDLDDGVFTIAAWLRHNEPQVKVEEIRAKDRERKRGKSPSGFPPDSAPSRDVERSREEKREVAAHPESGTDCEHGVDRSSSCRRCPSTLKAVSA